MTSVQPPSQLLADVTIGIVGAGLGGLALALALRHMGFPSVRIFEAGGGEDGGFDDDDQLLELTANGARVLHALGLEAALKTDALCPGFAYLRTRRTGFLLVQRPLGDFSEARYGAPTYLLRYSKLRSLLQQECARRDVEIHYHSRVTDLQPDTGTLQPEHGQSATFSAIIVADGAAGELHDLISTRRSDSTPAAHSIRARCSIASEGNAVATWLDDRSYCVQYPVDEENTELMLVWTHDQAQSPAFQQVDVPQAPEQTLAAWLDSAHPQLGRLTDHIHSVEQALPRPGHLASHWHAGRVALLGDACHPLPEYEVQGANAVLEDVWVLATMMERWEESPHQGFSDYQRFRQPRMRKLLRGTAESTAQLLEAGSSAQLRRNFKWSLTNRFLPEVSMAQWDWLYGYNCIKGFA